MSDGTQPMRDCPFLKSYTPHGRAHVYQVCTALGEEPLHPSAVELEQLCHGQYEACPRFLAAARRIEEAPAHDSAPPSEQPRAA